MSLYIGNGFTEAIKGAVVLSESANNADKFVAITVFSVSSVSGGKYISRTAQTHLERLAKDEDKEVSEYATHILSLVTLTP